MTISLAIAVAALAVWLYLLLGRGGFWELALGDLRNTLFRVALDTLYLSGALWIFNQNPPATASRKGVIPRGGRNFCPPPPPGLRSANMAIL